MRIFLIGLPGSGKSTLGKKLAALLHLPFIDLDAEIERSEGNSIPDIFEKKGEAYFREVEAKQLRQLCAQKDFVLATGGGAPCYHDNMAVMNTSGITIFLDVPVTTVADRIFYSKHSQVRPLAAGKTYDELLESIQTLQHNRLPYYQEAKFKVSGPDISDVQLKHLLEAGLD